MALYVIGDPHLSISTGKSMNIFPGWDDYEKRLKANWERLVEPEDTVVVAGDISWCMDMDEGVEDFRFLHNLPGRKIILKGNHDYWWSTKKKADEFFERNSFDTLHILHNNTYTCGGIAVCGTRGWFYDAENDENTEKIILREAARLRTSIKAGRELGGEPVVFLHYPPVSKTQACQPIVDVLKEENIKHCYYAHLHSASAYNSFNGEMDGIKYELLSADYLKFCPKPIQL